MRWEYRSVYLTPGDNYEEELDGLGAEGWELVAVVDAGQGYRMFLKRELD